MDPEQLKGLNLLGMRFPDSAKQSPEAIGQVLGSGQPLPPAEIPGGPTGMLDGIVDPQAGQSPLQGGQGPQQPTSVTDAAKASYQIDAERAKAEKAQAQADAAKVAAGKAAAGKQAKFEKTNPLEAMKQDAGKIAGEQTHLAGDQYDAGTKQDQIAKEAADANADLAVNEHAEIEAQYQKNYEGYKARLDRADAEVASLASREVNPNRFWDNAGKGAQAAYMIAGMIEAVTSGGQINKVFSTAKGLIDQDMSIQSSRMQAELDAAKGRRASAAEINALEQNYHAEMYKGIAARWGAIKAKVNSEAEKKTNDINRTLQFKSALVHIDENLAATRNEAFKLGNQNNEAQRTRGHETAMQDSRLRAQRFDNAVEYGITVKGTNPDGTTYVKSDVQIQDEMAKAKSASDSAAAQQKSIAGTAKTSEDQQKIDSATFQPTDAVSFKGQDGKPARLTKEGETKVPDIVAKFSERNNNWNKLAQINADPSTSKEEKARLAAQTLISITKSYAGSNVSARELDSVQNSFGINAPQGLRGLFTSLAAGKDIGDAGQQAIANWYLAKSPKEIHSVIQQNMSTNNRVMSADVQPYLAGGNANTAVIHDLPDWNEYTATSAGQQVEELRNLPAPKQARAAAAYVLGTGDAGENGERLSKIMDQVGTYKQPDGSTSNEFKKAPKGSDAPSARNIVHQAQMVRDESIQLGSEFENETGSPPLQKMGVQVKKYAANGDFIKLHALLNKWDGASSLSPAQAESVHRSYERARDLINDAKKVK